MNTPDQTHNPEVRSYRLAFIGNRAEWTCECGASEGNFVEREAAHDAAHQHQEDAIRERFLRNWEAAAAERLGTNR